ncbi:hypothetical protein like AT5G03510 [Hibiscus trionum]|uniref:C2H2-type domain-containing protein n=1 Tax=Hibiscus trionum TaxID=183268 RepID=A0A9W7MIB2_HIBTR|nr:hypothetical protein like AT5G03510 [Hibiscus trionum]
MTMVGQEEVVLCKDQLHIIKGKRTKRPRPVSPAIALSTMSSSTGGESRSNDDSREFDGASGSSSTTTSVELEPKAKEEDEENMAYCLMLLSQGQTRKQSEPASSYVHQCKTCNRCFPTFQALGGHRGSHKKPKDDYMNTALSLRVTSKAVVSSNGGKSRVHECSICGAEFSSGQALGGHMRRHRTPTATTLAVGTEDLSSKKPRTVVQFDLNLPAPEDDHHKEPNFQFASKEKLLVFSASSLVDCNY